MNKQIKECIKQAGLDDTACPGLEKFARLIVEKTLEQVDDRCYGRGENQWYYEDDKKWIRMHFFGDKL